MARLIYNGIELSHLVTKSFTQSPVMDESGTDVIYWKLSFRVQAMIVSARTTPSNKMGSYQQQGQPVQPSKFGETIDETIRRVGHALSEPRKEFLYWAGPEAGQALPDRAMVWVKGNTVNAGQAVKGDDVNNGPKPASDGPTFTKLSHGAALMDWGIDMWVLDCPNAASMSTGDGDIRKAWVQHRWTERETLDDTGAVVELTRSGTIKSRSDMVANADVLRSLVVADPPKGFKWVRATYNLSADGLSLGYEHTWTEVYAQAPFPAYSAEGRYTESSMGLSKLNAEVEVTLRGRNDGDRVALLRTAVAVCRGKFDARRVIGAGQTTTGTDTLADAPGTMVVSESLFSNEVSCKMRFSLNPKFRATIRQIPGQQQINRDPDYPAFGLWNLKQGPEAQAGQPQPQQSNTPRKDKAHEYPVRGTSAIRLIAAALKDPCGQALDAQAPAVNAMNLNVMVNLTANALVNRIDANPNAPEGSSNSGNGGSVPVSVSTNSEELFVDYENYEGEDDVDEEEQQPGIYQHFTCTKTYRYRRYDKVIPIAKSGSDAEVVTLAPPTVFCEISWQAVSTGRPPNIPDSADVGAGWTAIGDGEIVQPNPDVLPDGVTLRYKAAGRYLFVIAHTADALFFPPGSPFISAGSDLFATPRLDSEIMFPDGHDSWGVPLLSEIFELPEE